MSIIPKHQFKVEDMVKLGRTTNFNIEQIKKWLSYMPHIPDMSDHQICLFLMACKNELEFTKNVISAYFKQRSNAPELFTNRDIDNEDLVFTMKVVKLALSPERTKDNNAVAYASLRDTSYSNYYLDPQVKIVLMLVDLLLLKNPPGGLIFVINLKGVGIMHVTRLKIGTIKKFLQYLQEALPIQLKQIHILNTSYVFDKIIMLIKPFMNKELFDLIITHPQNMTPEELFEKHIPANCVPCDFGGDLPEMDVLAQELIDQFRSIKQFFSDDEQQLEAYQKI